MGYFPHEKPGDRNLRLLEEERARNREVENEAVTHRTNTNVILEENAVGRALNDGSLVMRPVRRTDSRDLPTVVGPEVNLRRRGLATVT